ncbi:hypothetical protein UCRPC4_g01079 [Phaeomoniella chlamydospora]|uniref:Histidine-specific methyltransferase SAM-dependent domain-containing protein n=1 Tax=Phaeomoniella chlamydospora TaxID=158046 RepID=A0A0G2EZD6_PHACM|nr:hypothetical protein UCRPC4_g01079 [Phaeomoniella chlamydospora]
MSPGLLAPNDKMTVPAKALPRDVDIIDIRREQLDGSLLKMTIDSLNPKNGESKSMPTLLLYDELGLKLFEKITYLEDYYLTNAEIETLTTHADKIAERLVDGSQLVELGSGNLRKVDILLQAFEKARKNISYYALDLSLPELKRTFSQIGTNSYQYVKCAALHGTYDDALAWLSNPENRASPTCIMTLGSSLGNFDPSAAADFLHSFAKIMTPRDTMLVGLDACQDADKIYRAYNDSEHVTEQFYRNGLDHANKLLGRPVFGQEDWAVVGSCKRAPYYHEAHYAALKDISSHDLSFSKGESLKVEHSYKYSQVESESLWRDAGFIRNISYANKNDTWHIHILSPYKVAYPAKPTEYASQPVPTVDDWEELWNAWDTVTRAMVPNEELLNKPIQLRNNLIFYLDIHLTKATKSPGTEPAYYPQIFERGIDPDVDDPNLCHDHSEIPDTWPPLDEILLFQNRVRNRVRDLINLGKTARDHKLGQSIWLAFEHEVMHLETFLYMLLQSERILPPPNRKFPNFAAMASEARNHSVPNKWFSVPDCSITIGLDDPENDEGPDRYFGWDNERPSRKVSVHAFEAQARPITNEEYAIFLQKNKVATLPASWTTSKSSLNITNGTFHSCNGTYEVENTSSELSELFLKGKAVRTVYGAVPLRFALDWPVMASYNELADYASWMNGRIPTVEEARSIYSYAEKLKKETAERVPSSLVPAVNG